MNSNKLKKPKISTSIAHSNVTLKKNQMIDCRFAAIECETIFENKFV